MGSLDIAPAATADYRRLSERRLPRFLFDYIDGGANDERTLRANIEDLARIGLQQRVMRDVGGIDTATTVLDERLAMPLALAPVGMAGMMARRGEAAGARAARRAGIPFTLSTVGICSPEEVRAACGVPFWFQLYMLRDRGAVVALLERAAASGCTTLVFTVDLPLPGMRHRDARNGMAGTPDLPGKLRVLIDLLCHPLWIHDVGLRGRPHVFGSIAALVPGPSKIASYMHWINSNFDPTVTWRDIEWLRKNWHGKLVIKGVLNAEDARSAALAGADGVVVSNHGGRQLDGVSSSIAALPAIAQAVGSQLEVLMDGGVRSGLDVLRAVALGARAVMIGRPWVWAASARGEAGLAHLLEVFRKELEVAMALTGVTRIEQIGPELLSNR